MKRKTGYKNTGIGLFLTVPKEEIAEE